MKTKLLFSALFSALLCCSAFQKVQAQLVNTAEVTIAAGPITGNALTDSAGFVSQIYKALSFDRILNPVRF